MTCLLCRNTSSIVIENVVYNTYVTCHYPKSPTPSFLGSNVRQKELGIIESFPKCFKNPINIEFPLKNKMQVMKLWWKNAFLY
jgi:hypothetical protein